MIRQRSGTNNTVLQKDTIQSDEVESIQFYEESGKSPEEWNMTSWGEKVMSSITMDCCSCGGGKLSKPFSLHRMEWEVRGNLEDMKYVRLDLIQDEEYKKLLKNHHLPSIHATSLNWNTKDG